MSGPRKDALCRTLSANADTKPTSETANPSSRIDSEPTRADVGMWFEAAACDEGGVEAFGSLKRSADSSLAGTPSS
jgi:hypothetical protein